MKTNWLKTFRIRRKLSQEELSARLQLQGFDISPGAISHWENERYKAPLDEAEFRQALANVLQVSVRELLVAAGYEVSQHPHSDAGERAAFIIDQLSPDKQELAIGILEQFLEKV